VVLRGVGLGPGEDERRLRGLLTPDAFPGRARRRRYNQQTAVRVVAASARPGAPSGYAATQTPLVLTRSQP